MIFSRALFIMDHADSALFHTLEDTVRVQNARALGIVRTANGAVSQGEHEQPIDQGTLGPNMLPLPPQPADTAADASDAITQHRTTGTAPW